MKHQPSTSEISDSARKAFQEYPRLRASADFNLRVLDAMEARQNRHSLLDETVAAFFDRADHIFENPILKLIGTALLGMALSWGCCWLAFQLPAELMGHGGWLLHLMMR